MCTSTVEVADALPAHPEMLIGDSTVERSGIGTSLLLVAVHPAGLGDGDGVGLGVGDAVGLGEGEGDGDGDGEGDGVVPAVNDCVAGEASTLPASSRARTENVYVPLTGVWYVVSPEWQPWKPPGAPGR